MKRVTNARTMRTVAVAAMMLVLCAAPDWAQRNRGGGGGGGQQRSAPAPHYSQPHNQGNQNRNFGAQNRQAPRQQNVPQYRPQPQTYGRQGFGNQPAGGNQPYNYRQNYAPQANTNGPHLQDWLGRNPSSSTQDQEKQLRNDPSFRRLPQADQQRLTNQLRSVDRMPEQQRDRRLARNEMLERLSPQERMSINRSGREWSAMPADRQTQMRRAFQDLRNVPPDQRQTVLNSSRYQNMFSPQERGILSDFLKVEPYEGPQR